jgi:hypothetical protein
MIRRKLCFYNIFNLKNAGPGLRHSGIGNCKTCISSEDNKQCLNYLEITIDEEDDYFEEKKK